MQTPNILGSLLLQAPTKMPPNLFAETVILIGSKDDDDDDDDEEEPPKKGFKPPSRGKARAAAHAECVNAESTNILQLPSIRLKVPFH